MSLDHTDALERGGLLPTPLGESSRSSVAELNAGASPSAINTAIRASVDEETDNFMNGDAILLPLNLHPINVLDNLDTREAEAWGFLVVRYATPNGFESSFAQWREVVRDHTKWLHVALASAYQLSIDALAQQDSLPEIDAECKTRKIRFTKRTDLILKLVKLTAEPEQKKASRYGRAIRFAALNKVHPDSFIEFLEANGGIDGCASAYTKLIGRSENDGSPRPSATKVSKDTVAAEGTIPVKEIVGLSKAARHALDCFDFSNDGMVRCDVTMRRRNSGALEIVLIRPHTGT
ncbi:hypothetical protein C1S70_05120 [Azospirillum argentinense]|uniref:Uncharacterized protein n=1 Tax=Azospirillum argentinense TaxID=2970906 RepID=A0A2K1G5Z2_9PROT|nr:hypothetical protein [Azospirillum argentinense]PNR00208.1 hypothetical protein C1S70_05120 [Azospirillum argentinense]